MLRFGLFIILSAWAMSPALAQQPLWYGLGHDSCTDLSVGFTDTGLPRAPTSPQDYAQMMHDMGKTAEINSIEGMAEQMVQVKIDDGAVVFATIEYCIDPIGYRPDKPMAPKSAHKSLWYALSNNEGCTDLSIAGLEKTYHLPHAPTSPQDYAQMLHDMGKPNAVRPIEGPGQRVKIETADGAVVFATTESCSNQMSHQPTKAIAPKSAQQPLWYALSHSEGCIDLSIFKEVDHLPRTPTSPQDYAQMLHEMGKPAVIKPIEWMPGQMVQVETADGAPVFVTTEICLSK